MFNFSAGKPLCLIGQLYIVIFIARAIISWFPVRQDSPLVPVIRFLHAVTEPVLAPFRRIIPPAGMFDLSFLVVVVVLQLVVRQVLCR